MFNQALIRTMSSLVDHFLLSAGLTNPGELTAASAESTSIGGLLCEAKRLTNPGELREKGSILCFGFVWCLDVSVIFKG